MKTNLSHPRLCCEWTIQASLVLCHFFIPVSVIGLIVLALVLVQGALAKVVERLEPDFSAALLPYRF